MGEDAVNQTESLPSRHSQSSGENRQQGLMSSRVGKAVYTGTGAQGDRGWVSPGTVQAAQEQGLARPRQIRA